MAPDSRHSSGHSGRAWDMTHVLLVLGRGCDEGSLRPLLAWRPQTRGQGDSRPMGPLGVDSMLSVGLLSARTLPHANFSLPYHQVRGDPREAKIKK